MDGTPLDAAKPIKIALLSPREGEVVAGPDVSVSFSLENYALAPSGNHVHVILDNEPYMPWYRTDAPCVLKNVKPGPHVLRVFPSRPWHESWKNPEAFAMVRFFVKEKSGGHTLEVDKPLLTYSRPKGEYAGDQAKKILLDFWVRNAVLSPEGYKVRVTLDGEAKLLTKWEPVWWEGLAPGLHGVVLELLDAEGRLVDNAFSRTERTFVIRGPLETTPATPHQH